jgi:TonB family protein
MPILETPPNPAPPREEPPTDRAQPIKVSTRRFGELEEHELIHLLDSIDDEIARARFRESIYVSIIICLAFAWLAVYGPRVIFHQGRIANPQENLTELNKKELPFLEMPKSLVHKPPPRTKAISDQDRTAQTPKPLPKPQPVQPKASAPGVQNPAPKPQPEQPRPQPAAQQQAQQQPPAPQPRPAQNSMANIPDAPHLSHSNSTRPNFNTSESAGQSLRDAANAAARGAGGNYGTGEASHNGPAGAEILSDTLGVDFGPYIKRLLRILYNSWVPLIPEETRPPLNKEGQTLIRFTINPDGSIAHMGLDWSTKDQAIDRAAWGSITGVGQFPPLPKEFKGPNLTLRIHFIIAKDAPKNDF